MGNSAIDAARLSPDGRLIALSIGAEVEVWDWEHDRRLSTIPTPFPGGRTAFDPSGTLIATAGDDRNVKIWDLDTGTLVTALLRYPADIYGIAFSPDGSRLAIGGTGGTVRVFDTRSGQFQDLPGDQSGVARLAFSPDGSLLAAANFDGPARIWTLDIDELVWIARGEVTRSLTAEECRQYLHLETCAPRLK
jgi:WD40 repeat protein